MVKKIKDFVWEKNKKGALLWVRPLWHAVRNLHRYSPVKKLSNIAYYAWLVIVGDYRRIRLGRNIRNGSFYVCIAEKGDERWVVKIPHLHSKYSWALYKKLRDPKAFSEYSNALLSKSTDPIWARHFPSISDVRRDGGYRSSYVTGHNLIEIRDAVRDRRPIPTDLDVIELIRAIAELLEVLREFAREQPPLCGDWALYNLIYDPEAKTIVNVDVEGLFTWKYPDVEANLDYIEQVLGHFKAMLEMMQTNEDKDLAILKTISLGAYATQADVSYNGEMYPMGYHSLTLGNRYFRGQRECAQRLADVPYDFNQKVVLDLGCNCGGMLHSLADKIRTGIGVDCDTRAINTANSIKQLNETPNLNFFTLDFEREPLSLISSFVLERRVDICFLLSVCMWLNNWKSLIAYAANISQTLLFEANGKNEQQIQQVSFLGACFRKVQLINSDSPDDPRQTRRALYLAEGARPEVWATVEMRRRGILDKIRLGFPRGECAHIS